MAPLLTLILLVVMAIFAVENSGPVSLKFAVWHFETSLVYVVLIAALVGMVAASALWWTRSLAVRRRVRELEARLRKSDADLAAMRNPLAAAQQPVAPTERNRPAREPASGSH